MLGHCHARESNCPDRSTWVGFDEYDASGTFQKYCVYFNLIYIRLGTCCNIIVRNMHAHNMHLKELKYATKLFFKNLILFIFKYLQIKFKKLFFLNSVV